MITQADVDEAARRFNEAVEEAQKLHLSASWGDRLLTFDKAAAFLENPQFNDAFRSVIGSHQYDQYSGPDSIAWRLNTLCWAASCATRVGGAFVECGVFKGDMAWVVLQTLGPEKVKQYLLYDSFEGFSPQYSSAEDYPGNPGFLEFANRHYQVPGIFEYVAQRFASFTQVTVVKGFLPESIGSECPAAIGFLHIDLNSPRAEVAVLEKLFDRVVPGGIVVFDDYGWKLFGRQREAEDRFMESRGYRILELPTGQGLVVK